MASNVGSGKGSMAAVTDLKKGLSNKAAKWPDASTKISGQSVNADSTRSSAAKTPKSLGPRTA